MQRNRRDFCAGMNVIRKNVNNTDFTRLTTAWPFYDLHTGKNAVIGSVSRILSWQTLRSSPRSNVWCLCPVNGTRFLRRRTFNPFASKLSTIFMLRISRIRVFFFLSAGVSLKIAYLILHVTQLITRLGVRSIVSQE